MKRAIAYVFLLLLSIRANAQDRGNGEYALTNYKINIEVFDDNSFLITERITAYYHVPKYGIDRLLPLRNEVVRLDGTKSYNHAKISNIDVVGEKFRVYRESGNKVVELGGNDERITGSKDYTITYLYNIGKDKSKGYDEFYYNLIGDEWDTTIDGIEFTITMPKSFDVSKLGFSSGAKGSTYNDNITYEVHGNEISGSYNGVLSAQNALTVRLELPDGYFVIAEKKLDPLTMLSIVLPLIFVLIAFTMWFKYGRDEKPVVTVEFYPPEGFNSAEVGFLYKGKADSNDVVSLLIYLANKGYISIEETEEKALFAKTKGFKVIKLKEYDGDNPNERLFLKGLFKPKSSGMAEFMFQMYPEDKQSVTSADLKNNFYTTLNAIVASLNAKENRQTIFEKNSLNKNFLIILMMMATFAITTLRPVLEHDAAEMAIFSILFPAVGFSVMLFTIVQFIKTMIIKGRPTGSGGCFLLFGLMWGGLFGGMPWLFITLPALLADPMYMFAHVAGLVCIVVMSFFMVYMDKRTVYGNELLGKIKGFKNFLETAEKHKLEALVMQNPEYFYNILPFTYVLGVSDKWIKKFETIALQAPHWYRGSGSFNSASFGRFISSTMATASQTMSSSPSSGGSGGSSSGGGSSGGGSGGGGGRSR